MADQISSLVTKPKEWRRVSPGYWIQCWNPQKFSENISICFAKYISYSVLLYTRTDTKVTSVQFSVLHYSINSLTLKRQANPTLLSHWFLCHKHLSGHVGPNYYNRVCRKSDGPSKVVRTCKGARSWPKWLNFGMKSALNGSSPPDVRTN